MALGLISVAILALPIFAATNIDDLLLLLAFFSDPRIRKSQVFTGQVIGMGILVAISLILALATLSFPKEYAGLLGLVPIAIGVRNLPDLWAGAAEPTHQSSMRKSRFGGAMVVAMATIASGGDNVGVYTPLFAVQSTSEIVVTVVTFSLLTIVWCILAIWMATRSFVEAPLRHYGPRCLPLILIFIGLMALKDAGACRLFIDAV